MEPPESRLFSTGGEDMLWVGRRATGASEQPILTSAFGTSCTCWGRLCHPGSWRAPCWWDRKTSHCAEATKFSCTHSEKQRGGQSVQDPSEAIEILRTARWHLSSLGGLCAISSNSLLTPAPRLRHPDPHLSSHTMHGTGCTHSGLPRHKRQEFKTHCKGHCSQDKEYLFNLHTAANRYSLQGRTLHYKVSQEQKI